MQSFLGAYKMHYMRLIYQQNISLCMHIVQFNVLYTFVGIIVSLNIKYENTNPTAVLLFQTVLQCLFTVRESGVSLYGRNDTDISFTATPAFH